VGELPLIGFLVGAFVAGGIVFYESTFATKKMAAGIPRAPEDRMPLAMIGGFFSRHHVLVRMECQLQFCAVDCANAGELG